MPADAHSDLAFSRNGKRGWMGRPKGVDLLPSVAQYTSLLALSGKVKRLVRFFWKNNQSNFFGWEENRTIFELYWQRTSLVLERVFFPLVS